MTEDKQYLWKTAIAEATEDRINVRGYDLLSDLTGRIGFAEMVYLLFKGELPTDGQASMVNALFVCCAEHGISPSTTVSRFIQAAGVPIQCSVAAGVMMFGDIHGGAGEDFCREIQALVADMNATGNTIDQVAEQYVSSRKKIAGYGHPQHREGDPRTPVLFRLADEYGVTGDHIAMTRAVEEALANKAKRRIHANIDAAVGAIVADLGLDWRLARSLIVIPRTAGLFAHAYEESVREPGWRQIPLEDIQYDGPQGRKRVPEV